MSTDSTTALKKAEKRTDWQALNRDIEKIRRQIATGYKPSAEQQKLILVQRARRMAQKQECVKTTGQTSVIIVRIGNESYAFESRHVRQVYRYKHHTPLPGTPAFFLGIVNLRGTVVGLFDLRPFFDLPVTPAAPGGKIIVLRSGPVRLGVLADALIGFENISTASLQKQIPTLTGRRTAFLRGITRDHKIVLDTAKLLSDDCLKLGSGTSR